MQTSPSQLLIVEGTDERHVVERLLQRHGLQQPFSISPKCGFPNLRASIYGEVNASKRRILGIVADANDHLGHRWQSISDKLKEAKCDVPATPANEGAVFAGPRGTRVGVWLMPDNTRTGELEDFIVDMIPPTDRIWPRAQRYVDDIPLCVRPFQPQKLTRAHVHAWLATRKEPRPIGRAITVGDLLHDAPVATAFVAWLQNLFTLDRSPCSSSPD